MTTTLFYFKSCFVSDTWHRQVFGVLEPCIHYELLFAFYLLASNYIKSFFSLQCPKHGGWCFFMAIWAGRRAEQLTGSQQIPRAHPDWWGGGQTVGRGKKGRLKTVSFPDSFAFLFFIFSEVFLGLINLLYLPFLSGRASLPPLCGSISCTTQALIFITFA